MSPKPPTALPPGQKSNDTRRQLMRAAKHLFALHGVDAVTVRDIVAAAGQRNVGSVQYYFGGRDGLLREILAEGAQIIDQRREALLDAMEAAGGPRNLREVIDVMVRTTIDADWYDDEKHDFIRFIIHVAVTRRTLFLEVIGGRLDSGHRRCIAYIRRLAPSEDHAMFTHRINCMMNLLSMSLSIREDALETPSEDRAGLDSLFSDWFSPAAIDNLIDAMVGIISQPVSPQTRAWSAPPVTKNRTLF